MKSHGIITVMAISASVSTSASPLFMGRIHKQGRETVVYESHCAPKQQAGQVYRLFMMLSLTLCMSALIFLHRASGVFS